MPRENSIKQRTLDLLASIPGCKATKNHGNQYTEIGNPDIFGCVRGRAFVIELKKPGEEPTIMQRDRIREWASAEAIAIVTDDPAFAFHAVQNLKERTSQSMRDLSTQ